MRISRDTLLREAHSLGFRPDTLEKVLRLIGLLGALTRHPRLKEALALKGGLPSMSSCLIFRVCL